MKFRDKHNNLQNEQYNYSIKLCGKIIEFNSYMSNNSKDISDDSNKMKDDFGYDTDKYGYDMDGRLLRKMFGPFPEGVLIEVKNLKTQEFKTITPVELFELLFTIGEIEDYRVSKFMFPEGLDFDSLEDLQQGVVNGIISASASEIFENGKYEFTISRENGSEIIYCPTEDNPVNKEQLWNIARTIIRGNLIHNNNLNENPENEGM